MNRKIAIIATNFLKEFIEETLQKLNVNFQYHIFTYEKFEDIKEIYGKIGPEYDGVLTSGSFPAHMIRLYYPQESRPIQGFNTDDTALYRLLLKLLNENRNLDFTRVCADIFEIFGSDLIAFVEGRETLPDITNLSEQEFTLETMQNLEETQFQRHVSLWENGQTDLSITRFSSLMPRLIDAGVKVYFPFPSTQYVQEICNRLLSEIEKKELADLQPCVIIIRLLGSQTPSGYLHELDSNYVRLENMIIEIFGNSIIEFSLHRYHYGLEILAAKKEIIKMTDNLSKDGLLTELRKRKAGWNFCIGYGFGAGLAQARLNALNACHEAELKKNTSYLITEREELIGPLASEQLDAFTIDNQSYRNVKSSLSPITVSKVLSALEASPGKEISAQELAYRLGITKRSANRFLSTLENEGAIEVAYKKRSTSRGRPENVFKRTNKNDGS